MKRQSFSLLLFGIVATILFANPLKVDAHPKNLNLTPEQKTQWEEIRAQSKAQIQNILTPEQQQQLQTLTSQGQRPRRAMKQLNLSEEQKTQMREIMQSSREQMANMLTEEQREQFRQQMQRRGRRSQDSGLRSQE
ncbi:MAG: Spy/CpxP family protein refolding chaperone [Cyanobacteriota bacterium]|nr:Spy/CpxP family protein refolding chaperone [Cyanobacteriota bacterium]